MKIQTSITIEQEIMLKLKERIRDGSFRNKSHLFEFAVRKLLEEAKEK